MMIDNRWERDWGSVLWSQTLVRQLEVDYIRVYQRFRIRDQWILI